MAWPLALTLPVTARLVAVHPKADGYAHGILCRPLTRTGRASALNMSVHSPELADWRAMPRPGQPPRRNWANRPGIALAASFGPAPASVFPGNSIIGRNFFRVNELTTQDVIWGEK